MLGDDSMRTITTFSEQWHLLYEQVAEVTLISALSPAEHDAETLAEMAELGINVDYRACELWMTMKDGRTFGFMASTPEYLRDYMERENQASFVLLGLLIVREMTEESILNALESSLLEAATYGAESLGFRMNDDDADDQDDASVGEADYDAHV